MRDAPTESDCVVSWRSARHDFMGFYLRLQPSSDILSAEVYCTIGHPGWAFGGCDGRGQDRRHRESFGLRRFQRSKTTCHPSTALSTRRFCAVVRVIGTLTPAAHASKTAATAVLGKPVKKYAVAVTAAPAAAVRHRFSIRFVVRPT
jgi:hypothetical protein